MASLILLKSVAVVWLGQFESTPEHLTSRYERESGVRCDFHSPPKLEMSEVQRKQEADLTKECEEVRRRPLRRRGELKLIRFGLDHSEREIARYGQSWLLLARTTY